MSRSAFFLLLSAATVLVACADASSSGATTDDQASASAAAAQPAPPSSFPISDSTFGVVIARAQENCLQTVANLTPGKQIQVILFDRGVAIPAKVGNPHAACGDGVSTGRRAYLLDTYDLVPGDFGIAVVYDDVKVTNNQTDIDGDGVQEFYRVCTSTEGVHMTVWNGHWVENRRLWHDYYYLGYDLTATCTDAETAGA